MPLLSPTNAWAPQGVPAHQWYQRLYKEPLLHIVQHSCAYYALNSTVRRSQHQCQFDTTCDFTEVGRRPSGQQRALTVVPGELNSSSYCSLLHIIAEQNEKHYIVYIYRHHFSRNNPSNLWTCITWQHCLCLSTERLFDTYSTITNSLVHSNVCWRKFANFVLVPYL